MTRQEYNKIILEFLNRYIEECPDIRFIQALSNCHILMSYKSGEIPPHQFCFVDNYHEESSVTLERIMS